MPSRAPIIARLIDPGIIAVIRAPRGDCVLPAARALRAGGVTAVEVALTTPNALAALQQVATEIGNEVLLGAGTVLDPASCQATLAAGAQFIVSPITRTDLVAEAHRAGKPVLLGAFTPTEAQAAHEAGADFVKLFPAQCLGPAFVEAVLAPLPHLRLVPTGGVDLDTIPAFVRAGSVAFGAGSALVSRAILQNGAWDELERRAAQFVRTVRQARAARA